MAGENDLLIRISGNAKDFVDELDKVKKKTKELNDVLGDVGSASAVAFAAAAAAATLAAKSYADYETALVGVGKTTDITGNQLKDFGKKFQELSARIPLSTNELLGIAQAAGQLGVKGEENLLKFTDTVAKLGVATDLSGEEAATALTRIINVSGESIESIDKLGSVIVAMGNNFAATESEIVRVTTEVARSVAIFNVSSASSVALATAMRSLGIQAELGGSAVGRTFRAIDKAIRGGGAALENLSAVTGMTGEQLRTTFKENSVEVFKAFIEGLGRIESAGGSSTTALAAFGLKGDEILKVLPVLAKNSEILAKTMGMAAKEVNDATALNKEAENAFNTLNSEVKITSNNLTTLATTVGGKLAPEFRGALGTINDMIKSITSLDAETLSSIASMIKWGAIIAGAVATISGFLLGAIKLSAIITSIGAAFLSASITASAFWVAVTGPIGIAVAGLAAVGAAAAVMYDKIKSDKAAPKTLDEVTHAIDRLKKKREELNKVQFGAAFDPQKLATNLSAMDKEIEKLEELRQAKIRSSENFGTGEMLVRPKATGVLSDLVPTFGETTVPLRTEVTGGENAADKTKEESDKQVAILDEASRNRIAIARRENETLKQLQLEKANGLTAEELKFYERKAAIDEEYAQARLIKNQTEKDLAIQNLDLKHADELARISEFEARKDELLLAKEEERKALREIIEADKSLQYQIFSEQELAALAATIDSKSEAEKKYNEEKLRKNIAVQNQFKQDELKYGTETAKLKQFFNSEEVQGVKSTTGDLAQLMQSRNSTMKGIGKAAASTNAAIATAEGAIKAYTSLAGIPIVGPALGVAAAGALIAFGAEQQVKILGANQGGIVPSSVGSIAGMDSVPAMLTPNELVVPTKNFDEVINATAAARNNENVSTGEAGTMVVIQGDFYGEETFIDKLADKLYDAQKTRNVRLV